MSHVKFEQTAHDIARNYWRIRAALAMNKTSPPSYSGLLQYDGIQAHGIARGLFDNETAEQAFYALDKYSSERLSRDLFIALIAAFEARLIERLVSAGINANGTLGAIQNSIQNIITVPFDNIDDLNEVRERRNMLMHHDGIAQQRYINACIKIGARSGGIIAVPSLGDDVVPDGNCLIYYAGVLTSYSAIL